MIDPKTLLNDLKAQLSRLEDDIRTRCEDIAEVGARLRQEHREARAAGRTAATFNEWREDEITQAAVAWILGCVFVRFLEDNELLDHPWISGPGPRLREARDQHDLFFAEHPTETGREYLLQVFAEISKLPDMAGLYDEKHNPLFRLSPSGDGADALIAFFQKTHPDTGELDHGFRDPDWDTRFLGDLYQDLSESARKKFALLQTPEFVEAFILDRTLIPAIEEFGLAEVRMIDPACGSGHFLLGAFERLLKRWQQLEPGTNAAELARRALNAVHGVDLNPYAVAIARFRLLIAGLSACGVRKLRHAPKFPLNLAAGDSLLHGPAPGQLGYRDLLLNPIENAAPCEDPDAIWAILSRKYHAVVGNPPYITVKDKALNKAYRDVFDSCHRKYALVCPFLERLTDVAAHGGSGRPAGYIGAIVSNSFMKREFGKKLIEEVMPRWDLTHVIDTSGAYIPGHGTPTCILFLRNREPIADTVRAVLGIKGEPGIPVDPARGVVWSAILDQVDHPGTESDYVSVANTPREWFRTHPWSLQGGGAAEVKEAIEADRVGLESRVGSIGFMAISAEDELFVGPEHVFTRARVPTRAFGVGEAIRDHVQDSRMVIAFPYREEDGRPRRCPVDKLGGLYLFFWPFRTNLQNRLMFGKLPRESGIAWYEYRFFADDRYSLPLLIAFAAIAKLNHFVLGRGVKVFKQSAPVIELMANTTEDGPLGLIGLLNSSTACFWLKQVCHEKGGSGIGRGIQDEAWEFRYDIDGTKLKQFPISSDVPLALARELDKLGQELVECRPSLLIRRETPTKMALAECAERERTTLTRMIALQEELDWQCYRLYGLTTERDAGILECGDAQVDDVPPIKLGGRAFEIVMARKLAAGELETTWFERHNSTPITELPADWPAEYRAVVEARIAEIVRNKFVRLIEQPEYKRRWATEPWNKQVKAALLEWLLNRLEFVLSGRDLLREAETKESQPATEAPRLISCARLADQLRADAEFLQVAELYAKRRDFDITRLVTDLVESDGVPFLPIQRYKPSGLRKRKDWEAVWELQRQEDELEQQRKDAEENGEEERARGLQRQLAALDIPVPPKYRSSDFRSSTYWKRRGKLDVPKERFVFYPGAEREADPTLVLTWAGWDHLQQAQALAAYIEDRKREGWPNDRLVHLLAGIAELVPWLKQWHNDIDPTYGMGLGDFFEGYLEEEARAAGITIGALCGRGTDE